MDVTSFGIYLRVRQLFDQTVLAIKLLVPIIAVAALVFAYTSNPAKRTEPTTASARIRFIREIPVGPSASRLAQLQRRLPGGCDLPGICYVITTTGGSQTLLLAAPRGCPSVTLTIPGK